MEVELKLLVGSVSPFAQIAGQWQLMLVLVFIQSADCMEKNLFLKVDLEMRVRDQRMRKRTTEIPVRSFIASVRHAIFEISVYQILFSP